MTTWRPSCTIEHLKARAHILKTIRQFFDDRHLLEVQTPSLSTHSVTDPHLKAGFKLAQQPLSCKPHLSFI